MNSGRKMTTDLNNAISNRTVEELLQTLVAIPSVYPNEQKISEFLTEALRSLGFSIEHVPVQENRNNIVATLGKTKEYIALYGHMDTAPANRNYAFDPFALQIRDGNAYGLGTADMKGGIAAILQTAAFAAKKRLPIKIVFGVDEKDISRGAHALVDSKLLDNIAFMVVGESCQVTDSTQDFSLCYGRKGRIVFTIDVVGKKTQTAQASKNTNAIEKAAQLIKSISGISFPVHEKLGKTDLVIQKAVASGDSFSVPAHCTLQYSLLSTPLSSSEALTQIIEDIAHKQDTVIHIHHLPRETPYGEGYEIDRSHPFMQRLENELLSRYKVTPAYIPSVADENVFANRLKIPVLTLGPIGGADHMKEEWVQLSSLKTVERVFKDIVSLWNI